MTVSPARNCSGGRPSGTIQPAPARTAHNVSGAPSTKCSDQGGDSVELPNSEPWARTPRNMSPNASTPTEIRRITQAIRRFTYGSRPNRAALNRLP